VSGRLRGPHLTGVMTDAWPCLAGAVRARCGWRFMLSVSLAGDASAALEGREFGRSGPLSVCRSVALPLKPDLWRGRSMRHFDEALWPDRRGCRGRC